MNEKLPIKYCPFLYRGNYLQEDEKFNCSFNPAWINYYSYPIFFVL